MFITAFLFFGRGEKCFKNIIKEMGRIKVNVKLSMSDVIYNILFIVGFLICVTNYANGDYEGYQIMYNNAENSRYWLEPGYYILEQIFLACNFEFFWFRFFYVGTAFVFLKLVIDRYAQSKLKVLLLYLVFPFLFDVVQIRNFMATVIVLYAIRFLERNDKAGRRLFILFILLATSQHLSAALYIIFILTAYVKPKNIKKIALYGTCGMTLMFCVLTLFSSKVTSIIASLTGRTLQLTMEILYSSMGWIVLGLLINIFINYFCRPAGEQSKLLASLSYLSCLFLPLTFMTFNMYRLFRNMILINYILLAKKDVNWKVNISNIVSIVYCAVLFYIQLSSRNSVNNELVTQMVLNNNYFFDLFK